MSKAFGAMLAVPSTAEDNYSEAIIVEAKLAGAASPAIAPSASIPAPTAGESGTAAGASLTNDSEAAGSASGSNNGVDPAGYASAGEADYRLGVLALALLAVGIVLDKFVK